MKKTAISHRYHYRYYLGLEGVICIADDLLVYGSWNADKEVLQIHNDNLSKFFNFKGSKKVIEKEISLEYFDPKKGITIQTDSFSFAVGSTLLQNNQQLDLFSDKLSPSVIEFYQLEKKCWLSCMHVKNSAYTYVKKKLKYSHQGIECTLNFARVRLFWPSMSSQMKDRIKNCDICSTETAKAIKPNPETLFEIVTTDVFEVEIHGKNVIFYISMPP